MGRGLSKLQKYIIIAAATKEPDEYHPDGRLYNAEIFAGFYGWQSGYYDGEGNFVPHKSPGVGHPNFHPGKLIDRKKYNTAQVVVRKACDRLEERGLVVGVVGRAWAGIRITDKGREVASLLVAEETQKSQQNELTPEEIAILDRVASDPMPEGIEASSKASGTSCCSIWDKFYECPDCSVKFEMFGSNLAPVVCPQCESRRLRVC